jgi:hypothetical protein
MNLQSVKEVFLCNVCGYANEKQYGEMKAGKGCPVCARLRSAESRRYGIDFARAMFAGKNLELKDSRYINSRTLMAYSCLECGYKGRLRLNDICTKGVGCRKCGIQKRFEKHRINFDDVKVQLLGRGIEVL